MELKTGKTAVTVIPLIFFLVFLCLLCGVNFRHGTNRLDSQDPLGRRRTTHVSVQGEEEGVVTSGRRRYLRGPGSYPPWCTWKCGGCIPCRPVHVPIPPGTSVVTAENYYPEAWRCKCHNRLYMP